MEIETTTAQYFPGMPAYDNVMDLINAKGAEGWWIAVRENGKTLGSYNFIFQRIKPEA